MYNLAFFWNFISLILICQLVLVWTWISNFLLWLNVLQVLKIKSYGLKLVKSVCCFIFTGTVFKMASQIIISFLLQPWFHVSKEMFIFLIIFFYQSVSSNEIRRNWSLCACPAIFDHYRRETCIKWHRSVWH